MNDIGRAGGAAGRKYGNRRTEVDGLVFASAAEARRYGELRLLERAGRIAGLEVQPRYRLVVNGVLIGTYVGDFRYEEDTDAPDAAEVVEDVKGVRTPVYRLKKRLLWALYGIEIREVEA